MRCFVKLSKRMSALAREQKNDVSRLGGDEFCILSSLYDTEEECFEAATHCAEKLLRAIKDSYHYRRTSFIY